MNSYEKALRVESKRVKEAINKELGLKPPSSIEDWERVLALRDTKRIQDFVDYWLEEELTKEVK